MIPAIVPKNENERLRALSSYAILDTIEESEYDDITRLASEICQTPISLISLIDSNRQWFKSHHGIDATETPRDHAFCAHAILEPEALFEINDSSKDKRFSDNPLVIGYPKVGFYAGMPLLTPEGLPLGTLCIIDHSPKQLTESQILSLKALAKHVMRLFELRKKNAELEAIKKEMEERNSNLEQFSTVVTHDIKSPLAGIISLSTFILSEDGKEMSERVFKSMTSINKTSIRLKNFIEGLLGFYKGELLPANQIMEFDFKELVENVSKLADIEGQHQIKNISAIKTVFGNKHAIEQILINLISNGIKYNDKPEVKISIDFEESLSYYHLIVSDNGIGIREEEKNKIFDLFTILGKTDRQGHLGSGIGLSSVKKIVDKLQGTIELESEIGVFTKFTINLPKQNYL